MLASEQVTQWRDTAYKHEQTSNLVVVVRKVMEQGERNRHENTCQDKRKGEWAWSCLDFDQGLTSAVAHQLVSFVEYVPTGYAPEYRYLRPRTRHTGLRVLLEYMSLRRSKRRPRSTSPLSRRKQRCTHDAPLVLFWVCGFQARVFAFDRCKKGRVDVVGPHGRNAGGTDSDPSPGQPDEHPEVYDLLHRLDEGRTRRSDKGDHDREEGGLAFDA
jgi:hypothetical protein